MAVSGHMADWSRRWSRRRASWRRGRHPRGRGQRALGQAAGRGVDPAAGARDAGGWSPSRRRRRWAGSAARWRSCCTRMTCTTCKLKIIGLPDSFIEHGAPAILRELYGPLVGTHQRGRARPAVRLRPRPGAEPRAEVLDATDEQGGAGDQVDEGNALLRAVRDGMIRCQARRADAFGAAGL